MKQLLKSATIIQKGNPFHHQQVDLLIVDGIIKDIAPQIEDQEAILIESKKLCVSSGWIDMNAHFCEPGFEHKEDLLTGSKAAMSGGFTSVCLLPNTSPVVDNRSQVEFIKKVGQEQLVDLHPYGSISKACEGNELSEIHDMWNSGAVGFTDGQQSIQNPNLLHRALRYTQSFGAIVLHHPFDNRICEDGVMNEGEMSTNLGLKGIPEISEDIMVARDIELVKHTGGKLHFSLVSSQSAIQKIAEAKQEGLDISCDIPSYLLYFNENDLENYDSKLKLQPPLRSIANQSFYIESINNGTIDAISSNHTPQAIEDKAKEFDHAAFGMINIQSTFSSIISSSDGELSLDRIIETLTRGPLRILNQKESQIAIGESANLTLFDPESTTSFSKESIQSKSLNSPFIGKQLKGEIIGVMNKGKVYIN